MKLEAKVPEGFSPALSASYWLEAAVTIGDTL